MPVVIEHHASEQVPNIRYTWLITGVLYDGGSDRLLAALHQRGIDEAYFYNISGSPIGKRVFGGGLSESFDVEQFHIVVAADQADAVFSFIYNFAEMHRPHTGIMHMERLWRSTANALPADVSNEVS